MKKTKCKWIMKIKQIHCKINQLKSKKIIIIIIVNKLYK